MWGVCFIWTLSLRAAAQSKPLRDALTSFSRSRCGGGVGGGAAAFVLEETAIFKILFDDDVRHGVEHDLDVLGVCGTGQVGVDFFLALLHVQVQELRLDVVAGVVVRVGP